MSTKKPDTSGTTMKARRAGPYFWATPDMLAIALAVAFGVHRSAALPLTLVLRVCTVLLPTAVGLLVLGRHGEGEGVGP